ncbi:VOC family protein [Glycomyces buryatensis]|uniref:VOC family protein n=1 Tax=Glycomyces buryatensis TaxID=2570927 RepID=A0A4S8Q648_9ACTN|nr:VOC family protein [Glycomyces buryatensis]THV39753.1 VOC family protein [Glycomyces buryatensis]
MTHTSLAKLRLGTIVFNVVDLAAAEAFWSEALGLRRLAHEKTWILLGADDSISLFLQAVDEMPQSGQGVHVDLETPEMEAEIGRLVGMGAAVVARRSEFGTTWTTMRDPAGYLFDVVEHAN